jgi:dipeptidyl aminopeptidase/acylaminoacyl peptidase
LEVLPLEGGSPARLVEIGANDRVLGWSPDSHRVLFETALDGGDRLFFAPVDGGPMREIRLPDEPLEGFQPVLSRDGSLLMYAVSGAESGRVTLKTFDLEQGDVRIVTEDFLLPDQMPFELSGRGGVLWRDGGEFLFVERERDQFEVRGVSSDGPSRLLRTFDGNLPGSIAVRGEWIAYSHGDPNPNTREEGASVSVMLVRAGDGPAREIMAFHQGVLESFAWSPDGNRLALDTWNVEPDQPPPPWGLQLLVLEIDASGEVIGEPILLDGPEGFWSWSPRWLPDGRGLLVQGEDGNVWRISSQPGGRPVEVTEALPPNNEVWDFRVSPDGRFIAYARGIFRGSSIWRVDLGEALTGPIR